MSWELIVDILNAWAKSPITQTFVGAGAGAYIAFHIQNTKERKNELQKNIGLINFSLIGLAANIEKAINLKKTFLPRSKESKAIKSIPGIHEYLNTGIWKIDVDTYNKLPEELKKYLVLNVVEGKEIPMPDLAKTDLVKTVVDFSFLPLPDLKEMAGLAKKHPNFLILAQRINDGFKEAINTHKRINVSIADFSRGGRSLNDLKFGLLLSMAEIMEEVLDSILINMNECKEVLYKICDETLPEKRSGIHKITIKKKFLKYIPKKNFIPSYKDI